MRIILTLLLMIISQTAAAQHKVTVKITDFPASHREDPVFITGTFNAWKPAEEAFILQKTSDLSYEIEIPNVPAGLLEFKFTRGDWQRLECSSEGQLLGPWTFTIDSDTVLTVQIAGWRDDFPKSTASPQVHLLDASFFMPQLDRNRRIWIYLPQGYENSDVRYPVLYMHDGQDLFDEATSRGRTGPVEWAVDETIDAVATKMIVVAVDHHTEINMRLTEYYYDVNSDHERAEGAGYLAFIVETLKPYIDANYRTNPGKSDTFMAGASMGGLISLNAGLLYPDVFGALGLFSPSIWLDFGHTEQRIDTMPDFSSISGQRYFFYAGDNESRVKPDGSVVRMHDDVERVIGVLKEKSDADIALKITPGGRHGAWHWRQVFPVFYDWLTHPQK